ncbi:hypothetical protein V8C44DRAFT_145787 [Trichoderma aethiopicum]
MDDATVLGHLPPDQREAAVKQAEGKFWPNFLTQLEAQHAEFVREYETALIKAKVELGTLDGQREELTKMRAKIALQLTQVDRELAHVVVDYDSKANETFRLEEEYRRVESGWPRHRQAQIDSMVRWFHDKRTGQTTAQDQAGAVEQAVDQAVGKAVDRDVDRDVDQDVDQDVDKAVEEAVDQVSDASGGSTSAIAATRSVSTETTGAEYRHNVPWRVSPSEPAISNMQVATKTPIPPLVPSAALTGVPKDLVFLVNLVDADDQVIGPIYKTEPWNQWVKAILSMPIKRDVKVRRGRKFTVDRLATIYDHTEAKGVRWLSCMIQATGEIQGKRCICCDKNQGAFDDCIIIGTPLFQKCGNCEWNRQGCHGAALVANPGSSSERPAQEEEVPRETTNGAGADGTSPVVNGRRGLPSSRPPSQPTATHQTEQLPISRGRPEAKTYPLTTGFTPANIPPTRPQSQDCETSTPRSIKSSSGRSESTPPLPRITKEVLVLKHKDGVYTEPEIVAGVPLEKISSSHPYWDPAWPNIEQLIRPILAHFEDEYEAATAKKGTKEDNPTKRFQLGRQVNRGKEIIKFLEEGEISPYQLLGKKYTASGKGSITSYDTLYRMCNVLHELKKIKEQGKIDIEPLEWMRHRLHELWRELGSDFKPAEIIRGFYNDRKMAQLREECGKKNIGRPRGSKAQSRSGATPADAPSCSATKRKRPSVCSPSRNGQDFDRSSMDFTSEGGHKSTLLEPLSPNPGGPVTKRARSLSPSIRPYRVTVDDTAEFTDMEVSSRTPLTQNDFQIDHIKSRLYTSSAGLAQYLHWNKQGRCLEHQTLPEGNSVTWRALNEPVRFDVRLDDLVEVHWNRRELKAHFTMSQRSPQISSHIGPGGDVIASFQRERSLKRLIRVLEADGVRTIEASPEELQRRWAAMQSETLSDKEYELSSNESRRPAPSTVPPVVW